MNKKIIAIALFTTLSFTFTACSSDDNNPVQIEQVTLEQLPTTTQQFIANTFPNASVVGANKVTKPNYYGSYYKITLNNRVEIDFDQDGNWTEIETEDRSAIPTDFLVQEVPLIYAYTTEHYKANYIIEIDRERKGYEVKLNNELELIFNKDQVFVGIDSDTADDDELISYVDLPPSVQSLLNEHFSSSEFVLIKKEVDAKETEYKVYTTDGFQLEFNQAGDWMAIESKQGKEIPTALFPATITTYIQQHYSAFKHTGIEKKRTGYEVELKKGKQEIELLFDQEGNLLGIDDD
ncbi:PepSY-like domain-containing protein [Myroides fluvii]|uniref:PepSY-like domain-containing protein n=1 Tax=Myroides fluvii TaxID=2572594 RepID=UPI00131B5EBF|nr:PepSY-like domain-containing protein [Myroides fluvii]